MLFYVVLWLQVPGAVVGATDGCVMVRVPEISSYELLASTDV